MKNLIVETALKVARNEFGGDFSAKKDAEAAVRNALIEMNGGSSKFDFKSMRRNQVAIFEVIEEILDTTIVEGLTDQFDDLVEIKNTAFGEKAVFDVEDYHLFKVASISAGNNSIRRQRLDRNSVLVDTRWKGISFYDEWENFMSGKADLAKLVGKAQRSMNAQISADIYQTVTSAFNTLTAPYKYNGPYDRSQLNELAEHVQAATQREVVVYGTKLALQQVTPFQMPYSGNAWDDRNNKGYFRVVDGLEMVEIPQAHIPGTDTLAISDKFLLVLPKGEEKLIKLALEGDARIRESGVNDTQNEDESVEYLLKKKYGAATVATTKYGAYMLA